MKSKCKSERGDVYERVANQIIEAIERGAAEWRMPWHQTFLCADLGIANEPRPDHAAYVQNWLSVLRNDKRAIFTAASKAQAAADWMHDRQPDASPVPVTAMTA